MASPAKKPSTTRAKKAAPKKPSTRVAVKRTSAAKTRKVQSFRLAKPDRPFMSFTFTIDTLYWLILSAVILLLGIWILTLNVRVQRLYDQIDADNEVQSVQIVHPKADTTKK